MRTWLHRNFWLTVFAALTLAGASASAGATFFWQKSHRLASQKIRTKGTVARLVFDPKTGAAAPVIEYETDRAARQTFVSGDFSTPPAYRIGEDVLLWLDPANPAAIALDSGENQLSPVELGALAAFLMGIGLAGLAWEMRRRQRRHWLQRHGLSVEAALLGVSQKKTAQMVSGSAPAFVVQCQWFDRQRNRVFVFESDCVRYDPAAFLPPRALRVLIDPRNPESYWVDTSFLPD